MLVVGGGAGGDGEGGKRVLESAGGGAGGDWCR